jgi:hypothetical protein
MISAPKCAAQLPRQLRPRSREDQRSSPREVWSSPIALIFAAVAAVKNQGPGCMRPGQNLKYPQGNQTTTPTAQARRRGIALTRNDREFGSAKRVGEWHRESPMRFHTMDAKPTRDAGQNSRPSSVDWRWLGTTTRLSRAQTAERATTQSPHLPYQADRRIRGGQSGGGVGSQWVPESVYRHVRSNFIVIPSPEQEYAGEDLLRAGASDLGRIRRRHSPCTEGSSPDRALAKRQRSTFDNSKADKTHV